MKPSSSELEPGGEDEASAAPEGPSSSFHMVAVVPNFEEGFGEQPSLGLFQTVDGQLFATAGSLVGRVDDDGTLHFDPSGLSGMYAPALGLESLMFSWDTYALGGRWPDALFTTSAWIEGSRLSVTIPRTYRWRQDRWWPVNTNGKRVSYHYKRIEEWSDQQLLGLRVFEIRPDLRQSSTSDEPPTAWVKAAHAEVNAAKHLVVVRGEGTAPKALSRRPFLDFDASTDGSIIAIDGAQKRPVAVHYSPEDESIVERTLPGKAVEWTGVLMRSPDDAWVWGNGKERALARFDGQSWTPVDKPCDAKYIVDLAVGSTGDLWLACSVRDIDDVEPGGGSLWTKPNGGEWSQAELPEGVNIRQIITRDGGDVWLADRRAILRNRQPKAIVTTPTMEELVQWARNYVGPIEHYRDCNDFEMWAVLNTPVDGDYEQEASVIRAVLREQSSDLELELGEGHLAGKTKLMMTFTPGDKDQERVAVAVQRRFEPGVMELYCTDQSAFEGRLRIRGTEADGSDEP